MLLLFIATVLAIDPLLILENSDEHDYWKPMHVAGTRQGLFVLTSRQNILKFDKMGKLTASFGGAGQGPGETTKPSDMVWIEKTDELWVADLAETTISIFKADGSFSRDLRLSNSGNTLHLMGDQVLVSPHNDQGSFLLFDLSGQETSRFKTDHRLEEEGYQHFIWQMFRTTVLDDGLVALGFVWANQLAVIDMQGNTHAVFDMANYYPEYKHPKLGMPTYFSQNTILNAGNQQMWIMTCDGEAELCQSFIRVNYTNGMITGRASAPYNIRRIKALADGNLAVLDRENNRVFIYDQFPFEVKTRK